jgi:hypothetical protein
MAEALDCPLPRDLLRLLKSYVERSHITFSIFAYLKYQVFPAILKDSVLIISQGAFSLSSIGSLRIDFIRKGIIKIELGRKFIALLRRGISADLELNFYRSERFVN